MLICLPVGVDRGADRFLGDWQARTLLRRRKGDDQYREHTQASGGHMFCTRVMYPCCVLMKYAVVLRITQDLDAKRASDSQQHTPPETSQGIS